MLLVEGVALKSDAKVWTFFVTAKFVSKKIGIVDEMSTNVYKRYGISIQSRFVRGL